MPRYGAKITALFAPAVLGYVFATNTAVAEAPAHKKPLIVDANDVCGIANDFSAAMSACTSLLVEVYKQKEPDGTPSCLVRTRDGNASTDSSREVTMRPGPLPDDALSTLMGQNGSAQFLDCIHR